MKKLNIKEIKMHNSQFMGNTDSASLTRLSDGSILKVFYREILDLSKMVDIDVEAKVLASEKMTFTPEILLPTVAVYDDKNRFCGYTMPEAKGRDYNFLDSNLSISEKGDLHRYANIFSQFESIIRKNKEIVFPDFCTCDNIFIDGEGNIQLIDYDGLQVGNHRTMSISTSLGEPESYFNDKYMKGDGLFSKELDKKSLMILYFLSTFNVNLNNVGKINPYTGRSITLDDVFACINLDDDDFCHKVSCLFDNNRKNMYLGNDIFRLAEKYKLDVYGQRGDCALKRLVKR